MPEAPANPGFDAMVLCLPAGQSLAAWHAQGRLDQHGPFLRRAAACPLGVFLVADPGPGDAAAIETLPPNVVAIAHTPDADVGGAIANHLGTACAGARVIIRTVQLDDEGAGETIKNTLSARGALVARIARGGHVRSRFLCREFGADAPESVRAGEVERRLCMSSDLVIGSTGKMADDLAWRWAIPDERVRVIPNFVDDEAPSGVGVERDPGAVLAVGPLESYKNIDLVVRAIGAIPRAGRGGMTLEIAGDGSQREHLAALAKELEVNAVFLGMLPHAEMLAKMRSCAAYVQASSYEGHPLALIEAMSSGAAVIVADTPGLGVVVDNGVSGVLVPGTAESFTYALSGVLEDEGWREMLGRSAEVAARRRYGIRNVFGLECEACRTALDFAAARTRQAA